VSEATLTAALTKALEGGGRSKRTDAPAADAATDADATSADANADASAASSSSSLHMHRVEEVRFAYERDSSLKKFCFVVSHAVCVYVGV
jgi:hypothetical protein